ncbi:hypothetical protein GHT06_013840 [Daphnia sinensis]|uniref:Calcium-activated chloride channel N-terminal domain-containing protein n=1 Tax=Daphnia sinensis TaxID=1820382 RepID=A0AAD5LL72_9CRUS|nr:hypothetical protein GHT06_013840 [Daphnia sinensis]
MFIKKTLGVGLVVLCLAVNVGSSFIKLGQQGYENVIVRIGDDVPSTDCVKIIDRIQVMMQEASNAMCKALDNRAYLGNVTIVVPSYWTADGNCLVDSSIKWPRIHQADFIVGQNHPVYGSRPFSLQYGGCGVSSLAVRLPLNFLNGESARGVEIAHEWFHYRYGVFEEIGINGDPLYPNGYQITQPEASILPTSCTNVPLKGNWLGNEWQNSYDNDNVTSSIMFSTELPTINRVCTKENHLKAPPTKQNWLCGGRSVSEIVHSHPDFINNTQSKACNQTRFSVVTDAHRGYHIVLDVSSGMAVNNLMENAVFAASHFVWFLPEGSFVSIDTFSDSHSKVQQPIELNMTTKNQILASLGNIQVTSGNTAALGLALDNAIQMFRQGMEIIFVTAAQQVPSNFSIYVEEFRRNLIAPYILALSVQTSKLFSTLARDGRLYSIPSWTKTPLLPGTKHWNPQTWMIDTMQSVYSRTRSYRAKIEERTVEMVDGWNNGTFQLDSPATNLMFSFYHLDDGYAMTFKRGSLLSPINDECSLLHVNAILLYSADCEITSFEKGTWSYFIDVRGSSTVRMDVWFEANPTIPVKVESWTNSFQNQPMNWATGRVIIYALVTEQQRAVSGLNPVVHLIGDNATDAVISVTLNENNPSDVTKGDGIYSAQLINLPRYSTHFSYILEIIGGTGTVDSGIFNGHPSAGSSIPSSQPTPRSTSFNRYVYGGSFQLNYPFDGRDVLPPGRITNLAIVNFNSNNATVELNWTGPKDDYGESTNYIKWFVITGEDDGTPGVETGYFNGTVQPIPGSLDRMTYTVNVPITNTSRNVYYRVYGMDTAGNKGQSSNIATVYVPAAIIPIDPEDQTELPPALFWFLIGLACVCFFLLVAIAIACTRRYLDARKRKAMAADWVQIGETTLDLKAPNNKETAKKAEPEVPDFHAYSTPSPRRSNEYLSSRWSDNSYSAGSEVYQEPERIFTTARIEAPTNSGVHERPPIRPGLPTYSFGENWAGNASPPMTVTPSPKKVPPPPPQRKFFPYPSDMSKSENKMKRTLQFRDKDDTPLASSPSYLAAQSRKENLSYRGDRQMPKSYSEQTLTSASNSSLGRFGIILGADSEASLV